MQQFKAFAESHFKGQKLKVLDVGSYGVNGTYREIFSDQERFSYLGLDLTPGPNVDYVPQDPYKWDELPDESFDIIISGQAFEHIEFPWLTILEMRRVLKKNGLVCIVAPSRGPEHRYPVDCWRYYPDGFRALAKWANLQVLECKTTWGPSGFKDGSDQWGDTICVLWKKDDSENIIEPVTYTGRFTNKNNPLNLQQPDYYYSIARKEVVDLLQLYEITADRVLEIGCAAGATGRLLKKKGLVKEYIGVEISEEASVLARQYLDRVITADIEKTDLEKEHGIEKGYFDLILCLDVLEHLYNPWDVLAVLREYLKDGGHLIASIPNIQNITVINNLINGKWQYEKAGILDATHLRFFTIESIKGMFEGAGLIIERLDHILNPQPDMSKIKGSGNSINLGRVILNNLSRDEVENLFTYQYIVTSSKPVSVDGNKTYQKDLTSIVILTFNQLEYTKKCVESIRRFTPEDHEIIFVDNGSKDGTREWLRELVSRNSNYRLIENRENSGFSKGCNQGIRESRGEFILLLNNDVIVTEGWLSGLLSCLRSAPDAGIVGPMTNNISGLQRIDVDYKDESGINDFAKRFRETFMGRRIPLRRVVGFCMLFRRELIDKIGLLDESFGTGNFEDDDLCLRAELSGFRNYVAGDTFIHHYGSRSFIGNRIDYNATMGGNRKKFNEKWNAASVDMESAEGKSLLSLRIIERAEDLYQRGRFEDALKALIAGLKRQPDNRRILYSLTDKLIELKQYEQCLDIINEFQRDDLRLSILKGYCYEGLGRLEDAERIADEALVKEPTDPLALNLKGIIYHRKGEVVMSREYFLKASSADQGYGEPRTNLGVIEWASGNHSLAIELLERGFKLSPNTSDIASLYHSAISQLELYDRAETVFEEAVRLFPLNRQNIFFLVDILIRQEKFKKAMDIIEKSVVRFGIDDEFARAALSIRERIGHRKVERSPGKTTLSLCMIVKNEEKYLAQCLESVKDLVDEMVIVDTGSDDRTKDIARIFGARVYDLPWNGDFSEARNFSLSKAEGDWILVLDADEVIAEKDHSIIRELIEKNRRRAPQKIKDFSGTPLRIAYQMTTRNYINRIVTGWRYNTGEYPEERGSGWMPSVKTRLFPNDKMLRFENPVHELIDYAALRMGYKIKHCKVPVHHYGKLNEKKTEEKFQLYYELGRKKLEEVENKPKALYELAIQASEMGRLEESRGLWEELLRIKPDFGSAYISLSRVYCELKMFEKAEKAAEKAVSLVPEMKEAHYAWGLSQFYLGNLEEAISSLHRAITIDPDYPLPYGLLSICYTRQGDKEKAKEYIERVKGFGFDYSTFARAILDKLSAQPGDLK